MKMKNLVIMLLMFSAITVNAEISKVTLQVSGLTCSMCNLSVIKSLQKLPFIQDIQPDVETAIYIITFKTGETVVLEDIKNAVKKSGFSVAQLIISTNFNNITIPENGEIASDSNTYFVINGKNKKLNGRVELKIVDKDFVSGKEFKNYKQKVITSTAIRLFNVILLD